MFSDAPADVDTLFVAHIMRVLLLFVFSSFVLVVGFAS
jgi:hypothetical protein